MIKVKDLRHLKLQRNQLNKLLACEIYDSISETNFTGPINPINLIYPVKYRQISVANLTGIN